MTIGKIARPPCDACRARFDAVIEADKAKATLADLVLEMSVLRARY